MLFCFTVCAQQTVMPAVSLAGIGPVKVGMKTSELDRLLTQPVQLRNLLKKEWSQDTVFFQINDVAYKAVLDKSYDEKDKGSLIVYAVSADNVQLKTKSGIGIGDDKLKIISTYEDYTIHIIPDYEGNPLQKSKVKSTVYLYGEATPTCIIFYLEHNKVTGFCVMYSEGC